MESVANDFSVQNLAHVDGVFKYLEDGPGKPVRYQYKPEPDETRARRELLAHTLPVYDGRPIARELTLDTQGFAMRRHEVAINDFYDSQEVKNTYYPEIERLVMEFTGAKKVVVFDHNLRSGRKSGEPGIKEPVRYVHNDYTVKSGPQRVRDLLSPDEAEARLQRRFAMINVWRPIAGPVLEAPLGVCDARSIAPRDFMPTDLKYRDRIGEIYSFAFNPAHRWFYFPHMQPDEALFLKCFDSADDGRAKFTAHSAFEDPATPPDAPPRESIEARTIVFW
ncbi:MAG: CmcJ/NvfI family oxidoreductase [Candidatus Binataceae bacterium]